MPTLSFKLSNLQKVKINKVIDSLSDRLNINKGDSLEKIIDMYNEDIIKDSVNPDEYIPPNVMETIKIIRDNKGCGYINFTDDTFYCLEKFVKTKKKDIIGVDPEEVLTLCNACLQGKADKIQTEIDRERRKASNKKLRDFAKQFMTVTENGFLATSYMCTCDAIDGEFKFSRDGKTLYCPLQENDAVSIKDVCMTALDPKTEKPPCQYLIPLEHLIKITKEDMETMNLDIPQFDYEEPTTPRSKLGKEYKEIVTKARKEIDAEYEIIEDENTKLDICPNCETPMNTSLTERVCPKCGFKETFNPVDEMTRNQLKEALDSQGIEYNKRARTDNLRELLKENENNE